MEAGGTVITANPTSAQRRPVVVDKREGAQPGSFRSIFSPGLFAGKVAIVTGGGSGIGRCTAHELSSLGAALALIGRKPEKLAAVAQEVADDGGIATVHPCDIREEEQVRGTIHQILTMHGQIDCLVNNAGGQFPSPLASISKKGWDAVVRNNLTGGFLMARECFVQWMQQNGGAIVNIVADMWNGMPGLGHSGAARAGMVNLTETAAVEWASAGVRVNAVAPGWIASSGMDTYPESRKPLIRKFPRLIPMKRMGTEAEVSAAIVFLLSPAAAFISGTTLRVDGAAPNARRQADLPEHTSSSAWNGFHRYKVPSVLRPCE
jgi:citronellol/citronellal dehydrogenase